MNVDRMVMMMAGIFIMIGTAGAYFNWMDFGAYWFIVPAFVGANLFQASITGFCPAAMIFKALGASPGNAFK